MHSTHLASSGGGVPGTHWLVWDWARQAQLRVASKGPEKELVETGETAGTETDRDREVCLRSMSSMRDESLVACEESVMLDAKLTGRSSGSPLLSSHGMCPTQLSLYTDDEETGMVERLVEEDMEMCTSLSRVVSDRLCVLRCLQEMLDDVMRMSERPG